MQPAQQPPLKRAPTTLPAGQKVYLSINSEAAVLNVWYHHVDIQIGIGVNPAVERAILNSIAFHPAAPDTAVLGRCPAPDSSPPALPRPTRLTTSTTLNDHNVTLHPEPATVKPGVSAATAWASLFHDVGAEGFPGPLQWTITFASYSAKTPAQIHPDGTETPLCRNVPTWLIRGSGVNTPFGPCGITVYAPINATTGRGMGVETVN